MSIFYGALIDDESLIFLEERLSIFFINLSKKLAIYVDNCQISYKPVKKIQFNDVLKHIINLLKTNES